MAEGTESWERILPFVALERATVERLVRQCLPDLRVAAATPLGEGLRGSNYRVRTDRGDEFLLKFFPPGDEPWRKEAELQHVLQDEVPFPRLAGAGESADPAGSFALYVWLPGSSLQRALQAGLMLSAELLENIGRAAAAIHRHRAGAVGFLDGRLGVAQTLPSLLSWYDLFLTPLAQERLGAELCAGVRRAVAAGRERLEELDRVPALVHGDLRPANILVREGKLVAFADWEFAMAGHPLADVGQLFRGAGLGPALERAFERGYDGVPGMQLPQGWQQLSRLRDLANLLQMIGAPGAHPRREEGLRALIRGVTERV